MKQIEDNLNSRVDEALRPFRDMSIKMEQAQVDQLEPEEQVEYWKNKAQTPAEAPQQQQKQQEELSADEKLSLANNVTQLITQNKLQMTHLDNRIWEGATTGMTAEQYYTLAQNNIGRLKTAPAPTPTPAPATPPPTTQEAPSQTTSPIETKSEAVEAFQRGDINIDEYRSIGSEKGWLRR
jgi:aspartokinase